MGKYVNTPNGNPDTNEHYFTLAQKRGFRSNRGVVSGEGRPNKEFDNRIVIGQNGHPVFLRDRLSSIKYHKQNNISLIYYIINPNKKALLKLL